jgi:hypothetical protein
LYWQRRRLFGFEQDRPKGCAFFSKAGLFWARQGSWFDSFEQDRGNDCVVLSKTMATEHFWFVQRRDCTGQSEAQERQYSTERGWVGAVQYRTWQRRNIIQ